MAGRSARWLGAAVEFAGAVTLLSSILPGWGSRLRVVGDLLTPWVTWAASGTAAVAGVTLLLVGRSVAGRRRVAWLIAVTMLVAATAAHLVKGLDLLAAAVTAVPAALLLWHRRLFVARPGPGWLRRVARVGALALAVDLAYGVAGLLLHPRVIHPRPTVLTALDEVVSRLVGLTGPLRVAGRFGAWFPGSLTALGALSVVALLSVALAPVALPGGGGGQELAEAAVLIDRADGDTLDPFVLRRDKRRVFSPDRRAALGYRYIHGVGLAAADPVGDPAAFPAVVREFLARCDRFGWRPAVLGTRADRLPLYENLGLRWLYLGDEAVIEVADFRLAGRAGRNVRQAVNRTVNAGVTTDIHREGDLSPSLRAQLLAVAAAQHRGAREFGFSMALGELLTGEHPECLVVVGRDTTGTPVAFQRYLPCRGGRALSLDVMRRLPTAPNGINERLIVDTLSWARGHGVDSVSLNFVGFRVLLDEDAVLGTARGAEAWLLRRLEGHGGIQLDTLRRFNAKFQPVWKPRYLVYRSPGDLPAIALAALSAEGYLPLDRGREQPATSVSAAGTASCGS